MFRIGIGYDSHRFVEGRRLILGGIEIPFEKGLLGHSDADVLCHSIIDSILGAAGLGDIGTHFPDRDDRWKGARSTELLRLTLELAIRHGYHVSWIDCIIITEAPRIAVHVDKMKSALYSSGIPNGAINIKAKTNEGMGFIGRGEGMAAISTCLLVPVMNPEGGMQFIRL